ncbi:MAG: hypothetical protein LBV73_19955 [Paraburkholderia sp.]|jgi:hypothetical protein|nr:hypothetical protein [Paraburkholderia sp.]
MNLQDQIGALDVGVDQLIQAVSAALASCASVVAAAEQTQAAAVPEAAAQAPAKQADAEPPAVAAAAHAPQAEAAAPQADAFDIAAEVAVETAPADATQAEQAGQPAQEAEARNVTLEVGRPSANEITMTIGGQTVSLHPQQVGQLIEELANARASMQPEPPPAIPSGWRFASTKNPMMAVQKQSNGDRLLVVRHTGHGWVPFTFSPDMVVQMYMMLTQR